MTNAQTFLQGDQKDAYEALLCLASGTRPEQCRPPIERYFSIRARKPWDTIRMRRDFLNKCPASNQTQQMQTLVNSMSNGAGSCDAAGLNQHLARTEIISGNGNIDQAVYGTVIGNQLPQICDAYLNNIYVDQSSLSVRYVGTPMRGGYWVTGTNYDAAQRAWAAKVTAEDAAARLLPVQADDIGGNGY